MINNGHDKKDMGKFSRNVPMLVSCWENIRENYVLGCYRAPAVKGLGFPFDAKMGSCSSQFVTQLTQQFAQANQLQTTIHQNLKDLGYDLD